MMMMVYSQLESPAAAAVETAGGPLTASASHWQADSEYPQPQPQAQLLLLLTVR